MDTVALVSSLRSGHLVARPKTTIPVKIPQPMERIPVIQSQWRGKENTTARIRFAHQKNFRPMMPIPINMILPPNTPQKHPTHLQWVRITRHLALLPQDPARPSSALRLKRPTSSHRPLQNPRSRKSSMPHPSNLPHSLGAKAKALTRIEVGMLTETGIGCVRETVRGIVSGIVSVSGTVRCTVR